VVTAQEWEAARQQLLVKEKALTRAVTRWPAPQSDIVRLKARMGWEIPWYTITDSFDVEVGVDEWHGHNAFIRDGDKVFRTYFINERCRRHLFWRTHHSAALRC